MVLRWFGGSALWFMLWWMGDMMGIVLFVFYGAGFRVVLMGLHGTGATSFRGLEVDFRDPTGYFLGTCGIS